MRAVLAAVAALACVSRAESALRGDAADGWTRAVANVYRATQAGAGPLLGEVTMQDTNRGLLLQPNLVGLPPGRYGFFVHTNGKCGPKTRGERIVPAGESGGVLHERASHSNAEFPDSVQKHLGVRGNGYAGDLPVLEFDHSQTNRGPVFAPRLRLTDVLGRSLVLMNTAHPDLADKPMALACGVVPKISMDADNSLALSSTPAI